MNALVRRIRCFGRHKWIALDRETQQCYRCDLVIGANGGNMKRWLKNLDTAIRQSLSGFCERRSQAAKSIRAEMFWDKLGWWVLNA